MMAMNKSSQAAGKQQIDLKKYFRVNSVADLFNDGDISKPIRLLHDTYPGTMLSFSKEDNEDKSNEKGNNFFEIISSTQFTRFNKDLNLLE